MTAQMDAIHTYRVTECTPENEATDRNGNPKPNCD